MLMAGALDRKYVGIAGQMGIRIEDATLSVVPGAGHAVHLERPGEIIEDVRAFLDRYEGRDDTYWQE
jgi:2-succinyl-6-hydroxy-2,4-cyclohexadiene-1-carboxylate synthase